MAATKAWVLWIGPGHRLRTCVEVPIEWLAQYRERVVGEWRGIVLGVYRLKCFPVTRPDQPPPDSAGNPR